VKSSSKVHPQALLFLRLLLSFIIIDYPTSESKGLLPSCLDTIKRHPPDFILLVHKDTSEYGHTHFGRDYPQQLFA